MFMFAVDWDFDMRFNLWILQMLKHLSCDASLRMRESFQCLLCSKCHIWNWFEESLESLSRHFMSYSTSWTVLKWLLLLLLNVNIFRFESKMWKGKVKNLNSFLMTLSKPFVPAGDLKTNSQQHKRPLSSFPPTESGPSQSLISFMSGMLDSAALHSWALLLYHLQILLIQKKTLKGMWVLELDLVFCIIR